MERAWARPGDTVSSQEKVDINLKTSERSPSQSILPPWGVAPSSVGTGRLSGSPAAGGGRDTERTSAKRTMLGPIGRGQAQT